jgi:hypothetical protein
VVRDPDGARADRDPARAAADGDRLAHAPRHRIDPRDGVFVRVRDPDGSLAARDARRCCVHGNFGLDRLDIRVYQAERVRADFRGPGVGPEREDEYRCRDRCDGRDSCKRD